MDVRADEAKQQVFTELARGPQRLIVALAWLIAAAWLLVHVSSAPGPTVFFDELCSLGWSRVLSGNGSFYFMHDAGYCEPGYGLLIAILHSFFVDADGFYRAVLTFNALATSTCLPLAFLIARRELNLSFIRALVAGILVMLYPGVQLYWSHAWPDAVLYPLVLAWYLAWCSFIRTRQTWSLAVLIAMTFALYIVHSRMIAFVIALVAGALILHMARPSLLSRARALCIMLLAVVVFVVMHEIKSSAISIGWEGNVTRPLFLIVDMFSPSIALAAILKFSGQLAFAWMVTMGLALVPLAWLISNLSRSPRNFASELAGQDLMMAAAPAMLLLLALIAAVFLGAADRFDTFFYGRYCGPLITLNLVVGLALIERSKTRGAVSLLIILGFILACSLLFLVTPPFNDYSRIHVAGATTLFDWLHASPDRKALLGRFWLVMAGTGAVALLSLRLRWPVFALASAAAMVGLQIALPYYPGLPPADHFPAEASRRLSTKPCFVHWATWGISRTQNHQRYRLEYVFPHCVVQRFDGDICELPRDGLLIRSAAGNCTTGLAPTPIPPGLELVDTEAIQTGK